VSAYQKCKGFTGLSWEPQSEELALGTCLGNFACVKATLVSKKIGWLRFTGCYTSSKIYAINTIYRITTKLNVAYLVRPKPSAWVTS
jgi:hypothetical protein